MVTNMEHGIETKIIHPFIHPYDSVPHKVYKDLASRLVRRPTRSMWPLKLSAPIMNRNLQSMAREANLEPTCNLKPNSVYHYCIYEVLVYTTLVHIGYIVLSLDSMLVLNIHLMNTFVYFDFVE